MGLRRAGSHTDRMWDERRESNRGTVHQALLLACFCGQLRQTPWGVLVPKKHSTDTKQQLLRKRPARASGTAGVRSRPRRGPSTDSGCPAPGGTRDLTDGRRPRPRVEPREKSHWDKLQASTAGENTPRWRAGLSLWGGPGARRLRSRLRYGCVGAGNPPGLPSEEAAVCTPSPGTHNRSNRGCCPGALGHRQQDSLYPRRLQLNISHPVGGRVTRSLPTLISTAH
ncbi:hypothetical protein NDU88_004738 [Pleurodeles waltl]|uniref:Uncharacterized protein n=1 Tax=Pleurodeles waltl TaxID=8319 RepID=A0AAV7QCU7_PLEWA|nr:hypothetical protein NDU88_004738 [Pleurodeles waltl]